MSIYRKEELQQDAETDGDIAECLEEIDRLEEGLETIKKNYMPGTTAYTIAEHCLKPLRNK